MTEEIGRMFEEEEKRLAKSHKKTMQRHREIMEAIERISKRKEGTEPEKADYQMDMEEIYSDFLENNIKPAPEKIRTGYITMCKAIEEHLAALEEEMFYRAFKFGYKKALEKNNKKGNHQ